MGTFTPVLSRFMFPLPVLMFYILIERRRQQHQQQQQLERGEFSPCLSPSGLDSREPYDHLGKLTASVLLPPAFFCIYPLFWFLDKERLDYFLFIMNYELFLLVFNS